MTDTMTDTINLEPVYREFVLKNTSIWSVVVEFVKANAANEFTLVLITVAAEVAKRYSIDNS